ncbi:MAG: isocitrate lyase/phosphoenolpyruvate mutase family protein [Paracoccaceae bacterium]
MTTDIGARFRALHRPGNPFILANAWDIGSAKMLAALGAQALGTSSAAHAFTLGRTDGQISRDQALSHASDLAAAVNLPISGDFENGFGDAPDTVAETVRLSAQAGLAGISIEDIALTGQTTYPFDLAVERIRAAASAARALPGDFVLVARADGIMTGAYDIDEALKRLAAFDAAGADCLYTPLPNTTDDLARICQSTSKPVNALAAGPTYTALTRADYARLGVARISLGAALARATHMLIHDAAKDMFDQGSFSRLSPGIAGADIDAMMN